MPGWNETIFTTAFRSINTLSPSLLCTQRDVYTSLCVHTSLYVMHVYILLINMLNAVKIVKSLLGRVYVRKKFLEVHGRD